MLAGNRGVALVEALTAMVILSAVGLSAVSLSHAALARHADAREREREVVRAERVLATMSLLEKGDLDIRLGERSVAGFVVAVQRPEPALYRIAVRRPPRSAELLVTVVYRPEGGNW